MLILLSTVFLGTSDVTSKYLSSTLPSVEIAWIRFVVFALIMVPAMLPGTPLYALHTQRLGLQLMRGVALLGSSLFFISGLRYLPIAEASATGFVSPLFVTALSIVLLGERVGIRRWIATAVGLIGVLIILRPGTGAFHPAAFFPIVSALDFGMQPDDLAIWFGILLLIVVGIGLTAPPIGLNVFVISAIAKQVPIAKTYRGVLPFIVADIARLCLVLAFPALALWLVHLLT